MFVSVTYINFSVVKKKVFYAGKFVSRPVADFQREWFGKFDLISVACLFCIQGNKVSQQREWAPR